MVRCASASSWLSHCYTGADLSREKEGSSSQGPWALICWHTPACASPGASGDPCASETIAEQREVSAVAPGHPVLGKALSIPALLAEFYVAPVHARTSWKRSWRGGKHRTGAKIPTCHSHLITDALTCVILILDHQRSLYKKFLNL